MGDLRRVRIRPVEGALPGFLIGLFQLVGRSDLSQFVPVGDASWYLQLRLWVLAVLSVWLIGLASSHGAGAERRFAGGVRAWSGVIVMFLVYMVGTTMWAPDPTLAALKVFDLWYLAWLCTLTVAAFRLCGIEQTVQAFWWAILGLGSVLGVAGVGAALLDPEIGRLSVLGGGPNVYGRNMGLLTLALLRLAFDGNRRGRKAIAFALLPVTVMLVFLSGSRGAVIALFVAMVAFFLVRGPDRSLGVSVAFFGILGVAVASTDLGRRALSVFSERFIRLLLVEGYTSNRVALWRDGIRAGMDHPLGGLGLAGFARVDSYGSYPHNIFVEAFAEGGVLGLVLLCIPFVMLVGRWIRSGRLGDPAVVAGLLLVGVSSSISGDLFDARGVFLLLLMAVVTHSQSRVTASVETGDNATLGRPTTTTCVVPGPSPRSL